ncbi:FAM71 family protein [Streptomyces profundus]|uniref:FAM71 family protein n=1 Tax=Streptomyces profundus TaxID=2867410 RepID=UPI001D16CE28|nr:FAM71 family protein [Streptomyces sp. MA3_2.13]UED86071.1 FAM71 family protein [Streptomyces sp. MA3_2.13]
MADGGFVRLPDGSVVVALSVPRPDASGQPVRVLVHAVNRPRALTRLRNLGLRAVYLRGNAAPPTPDEISAVLHHPEGVVWRSAPCDVTERWHPMTHLFRRPSSIAS